MKSIVTPCSLWSRVSPQHIIGVIPCSNALSIFLFTVSLVSAKYSLLSECPRTTYLTPASVSMFGEISPVKAPFSSKYMFSAPTWMLEPFAASTTGRISIAGTQNTTSTSSLATNGFKVSTNLTASLGVMFIFQFPAIIFFLDILYISFCVIRKFDSLNGHVAGRRQHHIWKSAGLRRWLALIKFLRTKFAHNSSCAYSLLSLSALFIYR